MRYLVSVLLAITTVFALMIGMSRLVNAIPMNSVQSKQLPDYYHVQVDDEVIRKLYQKRTEKPEPKKIKPINPIKKPNKLPASRPSQAVLVSPAGFTMPSMSTERLTLPTHWGQSGTSIPDRLIAMSRVEPIYPIEARLKHIEGFVTLEIHVNAVGEVSSVSVIESSPKRVFDRAAINAIRQWKFPKGGAQTGSVQQVTLEFKLES
jgi:protein TonB